MRHLKIFTRSMLALAFFFFVAGCNGSGVLPNPNPLPGETSFVSADSQSTSDRIGGLEDYGPDANTDEEGSGEDRTVEEGDIYRVLGDGLILNLNTFRGLQVVDFNDVSNPRVIGELRVNGYPVEMYVVGDQAVVLLNNYYAYYYRDQALASNVEPYYGGLVALIDIADPGQPRMTDLARVPGWIMTSRLTHGGGKQAVYVAASNWDNTSTTVVRSFAATTGGELIERSTVDLGGWVTDIQATTEALLVARYDWNNSEYHSTVAIIDISDPDGFMIEGGQVLAEGYVDHKSKMDLYLGVLRVASSADWSGSSFNHLQTFDVHDIHNPVPIDKDAFASGERLYASLFLGNRAFFVTFQQIDPLHAFYIGDDGQAVEMSQFEISGWNDFFKPVMQGTRMLGIGVDNQDNWQVAVSLYDITDLENPDPFIARRAVDLGYSWSEANYDDRAFSVLENAVSAAGPGGVIETGMVLLPVTGWDQGRDSYFAGAQIFTFSESSLTLRGVMNHGTWVRRSFLAREQTPANLSEASLSFFDASDPDDPAELGRVDLAPNYIDLLVYGEYGARLKYDRDYWWWWGDQSDLPGNQLQIVSLAGNLDRGQALATVELAAGATVYKVGDLAVAVDVKWVEQSQDDWGYETRIQVIDLGDPLHPVLAGSLVTDEINPYWGYYPYWGWGMEDCLGDCGGWWGGYGSASAYAVGESLVFPSTVWESELLGNEHICYTYPVGYEECTEESSGQTLCTYVSGGITCSSLNGGPQECSGSFYRCTYIMEEGDSWECQEVPQSQVSTTTECYDQPKYRYWSHFEVQVVDLTDPQNPVLPPVISMPTHHQAVGVLAEGSDFYLSYKVPVEVSGDPQDYARFYFKKVGLSQPSNPSIGPAVNVPGSLVAVDGNTVFTHDFQWGDDAVQSSINKLTVAGPLATLRARKNFPDRTVSAMLLDGRGHALVSHRLSWQAINSNPHFDWEDAVETLTVLDAAGGLDALGELDIADWAWLQEAKHGRALYSAPGGLLVVNLEDPGSPYAQAFFPVLAWPSNVHIHGSDIIFAAGRYGIYTFDLNETNLAPAP